MAIQFFDAQAPTVARCPCGGLLRRLEDPGPNLPIEAQCDRCLELTGVSHAVAKAGPPPAPELVPAQGEVWPF